MRGKLLAVIALLAALLVCTVLLASPYAPAVGPYREIEEQWAIEDKRQQSDTPLVTRLEMDGMPLAYDVQENVFYCPLGLAQGDEWPALHITVPDARAGGVDMFFADDYSFDSCREAIAEGTRYMLMAYTQSAYAYSEIVFTGLPILSLTVGEEITAEDVPAGLAISSADGSAGYTSCRVHRRGASTLQFGAKHGYRIEFTRGANARKKVSHELPGGFGAAREVILLAGMSDPSRMRDRLSWDLYAEMVNENDAFSPRRMAYVELFIDGVYEGVYLMMEPFDAEGELAKAGASLTDSLYRVAQPMFSQGKLYEEDPVQDDVCYELFHAPTGHDFDALAGYVSLYYEEDDDVFCERALAELDMDSLLRYVLIMQAYGLTDNVHNNLYIWGHPMSGRTYYRFIPWDMDLSWGLNQKYIGYEYENWLTFPLADRVIDLDVGGTRQRLKRLWEQYSARFMNAQHVQELLDVYTRQLCESGAFARDAERWEMEEFAPDAFEIYTFASVRFALVEETLERIAAAPKEERFSFLRGGYGEDRGFPIRE